ncbi:MAG: DUF1559 domain-containing protein [Planctomycetaceae bacterium]
MPIVQCPSCGKKLNLRDPQPGKKLRCPGCSEIFSPGTAAKSAAKKKRPAPVEDFDDEPAPARSKKSSGGKKASGKGGKKSGPSSGSSKSKAPLFIGVGILGIALAGGLAWMLMEPGSDPAGNAPSAPAPGDMAATNVGESGATGHGTESGHQAPQAAADTSGHGAAAAPGAPATPSATAGASGSGTPISLNFLPEGTEAVVHLDVAKLLSGPIGQILQNPMVVAELQKVKQETGFGPEDVRSLTIGIGGISEAARKGAGAPKTDPPVNVVIRSNVAMDLAKLQTAVSGSQVVNQDSLSLLKIPGPQPVMLWLADANTAVVSTEDVIRPLAAAGSPGKAPTTSIDASLLASDSGIHFAMMPSDPDQVFRKTPLPETNAPAKQSFLNFGKVAQQSISGLSIDFDLTNDLVLRGGIKCRDASAAASTTSALQQLLADAQQMQNSPPAGGQLPGPLAMAMSGGSEVLKSVTTETQGDTTRFSLTAANAGQQLTMMVPLMLPAITQARTAARRTQGKNNLKMLALAMRNFHDAYKRFPNAASKSADGQKLLSWRVHLLPFLGQEELYKRFALDEPWDSATNRPLVDQMPAFYQSPSVSTEPGKTAYLVPVAAGTLFEDSTGRAFRDITDGSSNTILIVEAAASRSVFWTQPDDLAVNLDRPGDGLGEGPSNSFLAVFADGSVHAVSTLADSGTLRALMTRGGGEVIDPQAWQDSPGSGGPGF